MLAKILIAIAILGGMVFFASGFLSHKDEILQNIKPKSNDPSCQNPLVLQIPVDINKVTGMLYPGQERGGHFKYHGGFRFDNSKPEEIKIKAPIGAVITDATRYIEQGDLQYMFDFQSDCGIKYRFDHLVTLSPKLAKIAEQLPEAKENDSRTTRINEAVNVTAGEIIATGVGHKNNVFVDFGVYESKGIDLLHDFQKNAVCWFDLLPPEDSTRVKALPADKEGKTSTICKP